MVVERRVHSKAGGADLCCLQLLENDFNDVQQNVPRDVLKIFAVLADEALHRFSNFISNQPVECRQNLSKVKT